METSIFFGGSVIAAIIAGIIALFAPCCISVMLPAYLASAFPNRRLLVVMTFLFAAGVATIVLPIALGASLIRQLLINQHLLIYVTGGLVMLALTGYVLLGGELHLPMPGRRVGSKTGLVSIYTLGIFSGIASSCCAPVLAGVIALSSVAASFWVALMFGLAYVFGMVAPLFLIALLWDRFDWRQSHLFRPRALTWRLGPVHRTVTATSLATGLLLTLIGAGMLWIGLTSTSMPPLTGWQAQFTVTLQHYGKVLTKAFSWVPNWAGLMLFLVLLAILAWLASRQMRAQMVRGTDPQETVDEHQTGAAAKEDDEPLPLRKEETVEF